MAIQHKELIQLINGYLDGNLAEADFQLLDQTLFESVEAQKLYWQYAQLHGSLEEACAGSGFAAAPAEDSSVEAEESADMIDVAAGVLDHRPSLGSTFRRKRKTNRLSAWTGWSMAACLVMSLIAGAWYMAVVSRQSVAELVDSHNAVWELNGLPVEEDGKGIRRGELKLRSGLAKIRFHSGAEVTLEGPARFQLKGENLAYFSYGKLAAHVPQEAIGFTINTPDVQVIDLGTDFGIDASDPGEVEVHVFEGEVDAKLIEKQTVARSLTTGRAARFDGRGKSVVSVPSSKARFARDLSRRRIALHATGRRLVDGGRDPHWDVIPLLSEPGVALQAAKATLAGNYQPNSKRSGWVTVRTQPVAYPKAYTAAFETRFDLTGMKHESALIEARVIADDILLGYELNGVRRNLPSPMVFTNNHRGFRTVSIPGPFRPGRNTLRFIVQNNEKSQFAFRAELNGTAQPASGE